MRSSMALERIGLRSLYSVDANGDLMPAGYVYIALSSSIVLFYKGHGSLRIPRF